MADTTLTNGNFWSTVFNTTIAAINDTDSVLVKAASGTTDTIITAALLRAYLQKGITPSIGTDGYWYIGGVLIKDASGNPIRTGIPAYVFALAGASFLLLFEKPKEIYGDVEWLTIFFFVGLFIIIGGFEASGGISFLANGLIKLTHGSLTAATMFVLWGSGILSGIIDNIPYTATMAPLISQVQHLLPYSGTGHNPLWWALSLGACLGGNLTIIGAAANVIVGETAHVKGYPISFMRFMKYGCLVTFISLTISSVYLYFKYLV